MSRLEEALKSACDTQACVIGENILGQVPALVRKHFPSATRAMVVADPRTWAAAGEQVSALLAADGIVAERYILEPDGKTFHADYHYAVEVREALSAAGVDNGDLVPVAVGSGVVNDLVKLASGDLKVPYLVCATAASVDGYSSFGAAIRSPEGAKKTYACPAPRAIVADLNVMRTAPKWMAASGFADLLAKVPAGADWILAYELGACEWHDRAWHTVQDGLPDALANPEGVAAMETEPMRKFVEGLMLGGFAMQDMQSSRPASGAEHMFSHILEMRDHTYKGDIVPHGIQVGVYTHFMTKFFEQILAFDYTKLDVDACVAVWPDWPTEEALARKLFAGTKFPDVGVTSTKAKYLDKDGLRSQLMIAKTRWPEIKARLEKQLLPSAEVARRLRVVGAPVYPEEIGTTREDSCANVIVAAHMRDRYNSLDFTYRTGQMDAFARAAFGLKG